ncbi:MAG: GNAT family N-acetyltransferase [Desulfobacterales bacterium]|nr:GNAT family N-acetyltransferase [Desulfobacterales bacterium]
METSIGYGQIEQDDAYNVFTFITEVFSQFVAPGFSQEGVEEFLKYIQPDTIIDHLASDHFGIMAQAGSKIIGIIMVRGYSHVALFFVSSHYQRKGVGRELLRAALDQCRSHGANTKRITVNASINSVNAYRKLNFKPENTEQCVNGIRFIPMALSNSSYQ